MNDYVRAYCFNKNCFSKLSTCPSKTHKMEKDKGGTLKSIMEYSKRDQSTNPYEDLIVEEYRKSLYHRLTSTILPYRFKQALIISGIILMLVVSIISTITVVFAESLTPEGT